jgi:hypothetical protein
VAVEWDKVDRYGRKVGKVLLAGLDSNLVQIKRGLAWHYKKYELEQSLLTGKAMQRPRPRPERRSWACGGMLRQCLLGTSGAREAISAYWHMYARIRAYNHIKTNEPKAQDGNPPDTTIH